MSTDRVEAKKTEFSQRRFADADGSIPYRLVGTYEYDRALNNLSKLVAGSTREQCAVYDEMMEERPEFSFISEIEITGLKALQPGEEERKWLDPLKRRGLAWMIALAKIELGATMSMYGNSKKPFTVYHPTPFDSEAFMRIMLDDAIAQLKGLANDEGFHVVMKRRSHTDSWTLAYLRRIKLIRDMMAVLYELNDPFITSQLAPFEKELKKKQVELVIRIRLDEINSQNIETKTVWGREVMVFSGTKHFGRCEEIARSLEAQAR